jgi:hypothetical protein
MSFKSIGNKGKLDYFGELEHSLQAVVARLRENFCALRMLCTPTVWTEMGDESRETRKMQAQRLRPLRIE